LSQAEFEGAFGQLAIKDSKSVKFGATQFNGALAKKVAQVGGIR
jgi:hypothetical protein